MDRPSDDEAAALPFVASLGRVDGGRPSHHFGALSRAFEASRSLFFGLSTPRPFAKLRRWFVRREMQTVFRSGLRRLTWSEAERLRGGGCSVRDIVSAASRPEPTHPAPRVAVVGAGLAGISCALDLERAGIPVVVLEATRRVGGRLLSHRGANLGAAWLHSAPDNPLTPIMWELGFELRTDLGRRWVQAAAGDPVTNGELLARSVRGLTGRLSGADDGPCDVLSSGADPWAVGLLGPLSMGVEMDEMSRQDFTQLAAEDDDALVIDGMDGLVEALSAGLHIRLGAPVDQVGWGADGWVRTVNDLLSVEAVVVTASTGVLRAGGIVFSPALPRPLQDALQMLPMGRLEKHVFRFERTLPLSGTEVLHLHLRAEGAERVEYVVGPDRSRVTALVGGRAVGASVAQDAAAVGAWLQELTRMPPVHLVSTRWFAYPWTRGSYSAARPGGHSARQTLATSWGRLHFAGEAEDPKWGTTASGAFLSGRRVARVLADELATPNLRPDSRMSRTKASPWPPVPLPAPEAPASARGLSVRRSIPRTSDAGWWPEVESDPRGGT